MYAYKKENKNQIQLISHGSDASIRHAFPYAFVIEDMKDIAHVPAGYCFLLEQPLQGHGGETHGTKTTV
ncbi:hypothetical protein [Culicoidibacter larvae]|uniref:Uncharacterized protein n=1 Tax=Culicoidibacter larvae TaxID=2579976 RepID=A0A5R8Q6N0_9FIRM|nr:hypothetical protein [Culicoidibacter larvae]TLG71082.1 hypothetical protein FEZ08_11770 [Culicoidibacter larvae]